MNDYELKQQRRRQRYEERADRARANAEAHYDEAGRLAKLRPVGQPILVGHHSERSARADQRRIERNMNKSCDELSKAEHYAAKAAGVGKGGISTDDPDALPKLRAKLEKLEGLQRKMKEANQIVRRRTLTDEQKVAALEDLGVSNSNAWRVLEPDFMGRVGFPDYALKNNNANIRRIKERIQGLEARTNEPGRPDIRGDGYVIREDTDDNRILFVFDAKPPKAVCEFMRAYGFRWSPTRAAWVRQLNNAGRHAAQVAASKIMALSSQRP